MAELETQKSGQSYGDTPDAHKFVFNLGAFVGDLTVEEDAGSDDISLEGLQQELEECVSDDEARPEGGNIQMIFEELLKNNTSVFVEELLIEHFSGLIKFVKARASEDPSSGPERAITVGEVEPLVKDFGSRWKVVIELMHKDIITSFSNFLCGMEILKAALTQMLLYYTTLTDCIKRIAGGGSALNKDLVSFSSITYEFKYSRTF